MWLGSWITSTRSCARRAASTSRSCPMPGGPGASLATSRSRPRPQDGAQRPRSLRLRRAQRARLVRSGRRRPPPRGCATRCGPAYPTWPPAPRTLDASRPGTTSAGAVPRAHRDQRPRRRCGRRAAAACPIGTLLVIQRGRGARARAHVEEGLLRRVRALDRRHEAEGVEPGSLREALERGRLGKRLRPGPEDDRGARACWPAPEPPGQRGAGRQRQNRPSQRCVYWCARDEPQCRQVHVPEGGPCLAAPARSPSGRRTSASSRRPATTSPRTASSAHTRWSARAATPT